MVYWTEEGLQSCFVAKMLQKKLFTKLNSENIKKNLKVIFEKLKQLKENCWLVFRITNWNSFISSFSFSTCFSYVKLFSRGKALAAPDFGTFCWLRALIVNGGVVKVIFEEINTNSLRVWMSYLLCWWYTDVLSKIILAVVLFKAVFLHNKNSKKPKI